MSKTLKGLIRDELVSRFGAIDGGVFISTQGLVAEKTYNFRKTLFEKNLKFNIIRNALAREAFIQSGYKPEQLDAVLKGPLGVVYSNEEGSATLAAKAIGDWKKAAKDKNVVFKGAFTEGEVLNAKDAEALKNAPGKWEIRAQLLGVLQAPITQLMATIREPYARVVYVLNKLHEKRDGEAEQA